MSLPIPAKRPLIELPVPTDDEFFNPKEQAEDEELLATGLWDDMEDSDDPDEDEYRTDLWDDDDDDED